MSRIKDLYNLLEQMIQGAERNEEEKVLELQRTYEKLVSKIFKNLESELNLSYDNCRQSCVLSVTMLKKQHYELISDAKRRFSRIPKPEN